LVRTFGISLAEIAIGIIPKNCYRIGNYCVIVNFLVYAQPYGLKVLQLGGLWYKMYCSGELWGISSSRE